MVFCVEPMVCLRRARGPDGGRQLGHLLRGRLAHGPFRAHDRRDRRGPPDPHPVAPEGGPRPLPEVSLTRRPEGDPLLASTGRARRLVAPRCRARRPISWGRQGYLSRISDGREGTSLGQAHVREMQGDPPPRGGAGHLPEPASQAAARLGRNGTNRRGQHPPQQASRDRPHLDLRGRSLALQRGAEEDRHPAGPVREGPHRRRDHQAARGDRQRRSWSRETCAASARRTSSG